MVGELHARALERVDLGLEHLHGRIAQAGVDVACLRAGEEVGALLHVLEDEGRGLEDGVGVGTGLGLADVLAGVQGARREAAIQIELLRDLLEIGELGVFHGGVAS